PIVNEPLSGVFTTFNCAGGGVQLIEPLSCAVSPPSALATAAGFGCDWQAAAGVVAGLETVMVTEACGAMSPSEQLSVLLTIEQVPWLLVELVQVRPPLVGSASVSVTFFALALPAAAGLLSPYTSLSRSPIVNDPLSGVFTTFNCAGGGVQLIDPLSCAVS